jgi:hypothetical protein
MAKRSYYTAAAAIPSDIDQRQDIYTSVKGTIKGYTPPPLSLETDDGDVVIRFSPGAFSEACDGQIECLAANLSVLMGTSEIGTFCPKDTNFEVRMEDQIFSENDPTLLSFSFQDTAGNTQTVTVASISTVVPRIPLTDQVTQGDRRHVIVGVPIYSKSIYDLRPYVTHYQVERYIRNSTNSKLLVDWTEVGSPAIKHLDNVHWDRDVLPGVDYGYRVRFRSEVDSSSQWSDWAVLRIS